jgi:hypothetical protein
MKMTEVAHIFGPRYSTVKFMREFGQKMGWATFWANFSQTPLVTLPTNHFSQLQNFIQF